MTGEVYLSTTLGLVLTSHHAVYSIIEGAGKILGSADEIIELPVGKQMLTLTAKGFEPLDITITVNPIPKEDFDREQMDEVEIEPSSSRYRTCPD